MPKCPKCGEEITYLNDYSKCEEVYEFSLKPDGEIQSEQVDRISGDTPDDFECPECKKVLFTKEEDAVIFLKGG